MADFTTTYEEEEPGTIHAGLPEDVPVVDGPARFLALAVNLGIPVLSRRQLGAGGTFTAGGGMSFAVSRAMIGVTLQKDVHWINQVRRNWFDRVASPSNDDGCVKIKSYITKRIVLSRRRKDDGHDNQDAETFAAMTTEMRILSNEAIRQSQNIVALIAISWSTRETFGRCLPEIHLEGAMHSSLSQYLRVSHRRLTFHDKALMLLDTVSGLAFLHENGIAHCDVKPGNLLVCDCPERQALQPLDVKPYIVKICDFGCSVILSDYPEDHQFRIMTGTPGWMAPEMAQGLALDAGALLKTDVFSLGHVAAAIAAGTRLPLDRVLGTPVVEQISALTDDDPASNVEFISELLVDAATKDDPEQAHLDFIYDGAQKARLDKTQLALFSEILIRTLQMVPSRRADAAEIYRLCHDQLLKELHKLHSEQRFDGGGSGGIVPLESMLPQCAGKPLTKIGVIDKACDTMVPDFAFETDIRSLLIPRGCRKEVYGDLARRVNNNSQDAGDCALVQLAALVLNGYVDDEGKMKEKVEAFLVKAIESGNQAAMSGTMNVFQAMGRELPRNMEDRILQRFRDRDFREQGIIEIKSLFFPLTFDTSTTPKPATGAACFPYVHRQDINEKLVGVRTWAREFKQDFTDYLNSKEYRNDLYAAALRVTEEYGPVVFSQRTHPPFHSAVDRYVHDPDVRLDLLNAHERNNFIREVLDRDKPDAPTALGLTLLQLAVCRGDTLAARTLLEASIGADANAHGTTPSWSPLWLACFLGHYEMATMLIEHGADLTCRDSVQGITILHLLSQFSSQDMVEGIGYQVLAAGVDVNTGFVPYEDEQTGVTPLLASMIVFDFSDGAAARFLIENGANPLYFTTSYSEAYKLPVSPLSVAMLNLDVRLVESILSADFPAWPRTDRGTSDRVAQSIGVQLMRTKTCFRAMFEMGRNYKNLKSILRVVSPWFEMRTFYWKRTWSPLAYAFDIDRADMMKLLLLMDPHAELEVDDIEERVDITQQCFVRNNFRCVKALIRHGADVLQSTGIVDTSFASLLGGEHMGEGLMRHMFSGETRLSRIAKDMPSILGFVLDHLESLPAEKRRGKSLKDILESWQIDTAGLFDTLVLEGGSEELVIAEALRVKYRLGHDRVQPFPPNATTLIGALIVWSNAYGYGRLDQIQYLLSLKPKPKFDLPSKVNLLQLALMISEGTDALEQLELVRALLKAYPAIDNLTRGWRHQLPPLMQAATGTNLEVIRLMEDHVRINHPGKKMPYNHLHHRAEREDGSPVMMTMLDACLLGIQDRGLVDRQYGYGMIGRGQRRGNDDEVKLSLVDQLGRHYSRKAIFKYLRENGAQFWYEIDGYFIGARILFLPSVSKLKLYAFMQRMTAKLCLGPWNHFVRGRDNVTWEDVKTSISSTGQLISHHLPDFTDNISLLASCLEPSSLAAQFQFLRIFEVKWSENCLRLYVCDLAFPKADTSTKVNSYLSARVEQRHGWGRTYGENPPYLGNKCLEPWIVQQDEEKGVDFVKYKRPGRVWTQDEVDGVAETVFAEFSEEFGKEEDEVPAELRAAVMSYF